MARPVSSSGRCPVDHQALSDHKTMPELEPANPPVSRDAEGVWHVRSYALARQILRSNDTTQAGFHAEEIMPALNVMKAPVLYQDGKPHHEQRKQIARFFAPKFVSDNYRLMMEGFADGLIAEIQQRGRVDLSEISMRMAVRVAAEVVGLTNSLIAGLDRRLADFFTSELQPFSYHPRAIMEFLRSQKRLLAFYLCDVRPAIAARRRQPREDVISHLLANNYGDAEILTECVTYGAAGMVTTREFIGVAAWHLLDRPALMQRYVQAAEPERVAILHELLRLEPVVSRLYRRASKNLLLEQNGVPLIIPAGSLIDLHINPANTDAQLVGENPHQVCPGRALSDDRAGAPVLSFGDGHHRCPGAYIAIQETDIFLRKLLALPGLRMERAPTVGWNPLAKGYELRDFVLVVG